MILSQKQIEEIAASTAKDFNRFFFGDEADKPDRPALPTPIDQFAKNYLGLQVSYIRRRKLYNQHTTSFTPREITQSEAHT